MNTEDYLAHYGVKGMKWGVRRYENKAKKYRAKASAAKTAKEHAKYTTKALNSTERAKLRALDSFYTTNNKAQALRSKGNVTKAKEYEKLRRDYAKRVEKADKYISSTVASHNSKKYTTTSKNATYNIHKGMTAVSAILGAGATVSRIGFELTTGVKDPGLRMLNWAATGNAAGISAASGRSGKKYKVYANK